VGDAAEAGGPQAPHAEYIGVVQSGADSASYTFDAVQIGQAASDRTIVVAVHSATNLALQYTELHIGNVAAQKVVALGEGVAPSGPTALYVASVPTGSTANIRVDMSAMAVRCAVAVHALYGLDSTTPNDTKTAESQNAASLSIDVPSGGVAISALSRAGAGSSAIWTGIDERYDFMLTEATPGIPTLFSGASLSNSATGGNHAIGITGTPPQTFAIRAVAASFR
jgi:hypothetical protein